MAYVMKIRISNNQQWLLQDKHSTHAKNTFHEYVIIARGIEPQDKNIQAIFEKPFCQSFQ